MPNPFCYLLLPLLAVAIAYHTGLSAVQVHVSDSVKATKDRPERINEFLRGRVKKKFGQTLDFVQSLPNPPPPSETLDATLKVDSLFWPPGLKIRGVNLLCLMTRCFDHFSKYRFGLRGSRSEPPPPCLDKVQSLTTFFFYRSPKSSR